MTLDQAVALSLAENLSRVGLTARLRDGDPTLDERARPLLDQAREARARAGSLGIETLAWNDPRYPERLLTLTDCPPLLWCRGDLAAFDGPPERARAEDFRPPEIPRGIDRDAVRERPASIDPDVPGAARRRHEKKVRILPSREERERLRQTGIAGAR